MVNAYGQAEGRIGAKEQLDPIPVVVRVDAANFESPRTARRFEFGSVEVDKKLVRVGHSRRDGSNQADFSSHDGRLCKFSASMRHAIDAEFTTVEFRTGVRSYRRAGKRRGSSRGEEFGSGSRY